MPRGHQQKPAHALALHLPQPVVPMSPEPRVPLHGTLPTINATFLQTKSHVSLPGAHRCCSPVQLCGFPFSLFSPWRSQGHRQHGRTDTSRCWIPLGRPRGVCSLPACADNIFRPPGENQHPPGSPGAASMGNFRAGNRKKLLPLHHFFCCFVLRVRCFWMS